MAEESPKKKAKTVGSYDVVVGLPSYGEEETISFVTSVVDAGCLKYFPGKKCLLLNADCKSPDKTKERFLETKTTCDKEYHSTALQAEGKGAGLRLVFERMKELRTPVGFCVDTDLTTITPEWVRSFATALNQGADMVTPRYARHRCDGTITNLVTYPGVSALFSLAVRQPIGGDFGFSLRAVEAYLAPEWTPMTKKYGVDIFMTTTVIKSGYRLCEAELPAKIHSPSLPKLVGMVENVLDSFLYQIKASKDIITQSLDKPVTRPLLACWGGGGDMSVPEMKADPSVLHGKAKELFAAHTDVLKEQTPAAIITDVASLVETGRLTPEVWAKLLFWGIDRFVQGDEKNERHVVRVLQLGYLLRAVSHLETVQNITNEEAEVVMENQRALILQERDALKKKWS